MTEIAPSRLPELSRFFLRLGLTGFGGPAAHIALMETEAVERRGWITRERFLDLLGACNLLPGPSSTQVAMALGYTRAGWAGLAIAGACFITPAATFTLALAWAYVRYGHLAQVQGLLYGAKPVMVAIVLQAIWRLARMALRTRALLLTGVLCLAANLGGVTPIAVLLAAGAVFAAWAARGRVKVTRGGVFAFAPVAGVAAGPGSPAVLSIVLVFLKLGVVVFGSGYVLLAFLQADLVDRLHWVTKTQLLDAITAGQVTPGPLFATATFLGYLLHGYTGAVAATLAIFLPSFFMAGLVGAMAGRLRKSPALAGFLDGVNAAAVALMAVVTLALGRAALVDVWTWGIGLVSAALLLRFRLNATWLILSGAVLGIVLQVMR
ncbi:chromate efflux transporter [Occallatibacter riparius]|uniref:Chromate efflux transporter n=1 Tax=Occallatibacter riparius TaxID=1002689 RepID=A0A9J7BWG8_9BACT|nr:chromate efflux transporter [Occallatibacter riparius]UWZ85357.1 chromate efflux transporter [Occallatibacter riparius]